MTPTQDIRRLKYAVEACVNGVWGDEPNGEDDMVVVRVADFDRAKGVATPGDSPTVRAIPESARNRRVLRPGDLLIEKSGGGEQQPVGNVVLFTDERSAVCSNFVARMPVVADCDSRFVGYVFRALYAEGRNVPHIKQTSGIQNLDSESYLNETAWLPARGVQERIANFLDEQTGRIDALIAEKDRLSRTLDELRLSKLEAEMAGALAAGSQQLRRVLLSLSQGWSPVAESYPAAPDAWGVLKLSAIKNGRFVSSENKQVSIGTEVPEELRVRKGDVLLTRANTPQLVGSVALVSDDFHCLFPSDLIYTLRINPRKFDSAFLVLYLQSPQARAQIEVDARGSSQSMVKLSQEHICSWQIPQLPLHRQAEVVERIKHQFSAISSLKKHVAEHINRLREYRSSLISAAVTGQLDLSTFKEVQ